MGTVDTPPRIAVVGSTMIDLVAYAQRVPEAGETLVGDRFTMGFGGKGANQAVMASLLGADVLMVNCLGDDIYGDLTLENFNSFGIDTTHVGRVAGASGMAPIWVEPDGTNRIIIIPGANHAMSADDARRALATSPPPRVVVGQLEIPQLVTASGFLAARERGAITILNPAPAAALERDLISTTDWFIPNEVEFRSIAGGDAEDDAILVSFANEVGVRLVVTLGDKGAALVDREQRVRRIPAPRVRAIDTTGAGDAFVGAFAYGLAADLGETTAVHLGIACASDSVTRAGTQSSFARPEQVADLISRAVADSVR